MKGAKTMRNDEKRERQARPGANAADWMLEPYARGENMTDAAIVARARAMDAGRTTYAELREGISRREWRRTELARRHAPVWMLERYREELNILYLALAEVETRLYELGIDVRTW